MTKHAVPENLPPLAPRPSGRGMPVTWRSAAPDRDARTFLRMVNLATRFSPTGTHSLQAIREVWRLSALALGRRPAVAEVWDLEIEGPDGPVALRVFVPRRSEQPLPAFLWVHGGGFIAGGLDTADAICRNIALAADCITVAVRYRLAPEHDLNAGRADCLAALEWLARHGAELGIDTQRLAIGGDSAGGNISAAIAQEIHRRQEIELALQVLVYPATELAEAFPSLGENAEGYMVTQDMLTLIQGVVAGSLEHLDPVAPWLSPRRNPDLQGLAPAVVVSAGFDPIRDDGLDYAARLRAAEVPVQLLHYPGQFHGFLNFDAINAGARDALQRIGEALTLAFDGIHGDATVEIADASERSGLVGETAGATLAIWNATDGWRDALLLQLSPRLARITHWALGPYRASTRLLRRCLNTSAERQVAAQTYPTGS